MRFHERAPYRPITRRPTLEWPNGARLAVWVVVNIEHYDEESLNAPVIGAGGAALPDILNYSWKDYGNRVGVWRTIKDLDRANIPATVAMNSDVCRFYPAIAEACVDRSWDLIGHGRRNNETLGQVSTAQEERTLIAAALDEIETFTGRRPDGWLGPGLQETSRTPDILAELGVRYVCDWINDDQPYWLQTASRPIIAMPYSAELNDLGLFVRRGHTGDDYERLLIDTFKELREDCVEAARVMCIALHPFITGTPARARHLRFALEYMRRHTDVWFATGSQIADSYRAQVPSTDSGSPR